MSCFWVQKNDDIRYPAMLPKTGSRARKKVLPLFELARVLVRFDHVASFITNPLTAI
jgi:hypothetical protein